MQIRSFAGKETIHQLYGTRVAVLAGDFMFAQSSWFLANLENIEVIKLISQVPRFGDLLCFS
jgi:all-trans-nonaprenyl-diphosphate synthase